MGRGAGEGRPPRHEHRATLAVAPGSEHDALHPRPAQVAVQVAVAAAPDGSPAGAPPAEALRQASKSYRRRFPQAPPLLWGGFMSFGGDPLPAAGGLPWAYVFATGAGLLLLLGMAWLGRRNLRHFF
ncbi:MAG: hypothetical protein D6722_08620 [Bacteroidetes bacterium]|nr:MAG: hypothetical protein D6722_08620 [Bacteroidota bacterium]